MTKFEKIFSCVLLGFFIIYFFSESYWSGNAGIEMLIRISGALALIAIFIAMRKCFGFFKILFSEKRFDSSLFWQSFFLGFLALFIFLFWLFWVAIMGIASIA